MTNRLKLGLFLSIAIHVFLSGNSLTLWATAEAKSHSPKQGEATEFYYLPLVTNFPPVWFVKSPDSPIYLQNYANNAGCNWLGIAGEVFDLQGEPAPLGAYQVHVWESGVDIRVLVGGTPAYGPSGYEVFLFDSPRVQDHKLQLETPDGRFASPIYEVQTRASCHENLLYFIFLQDY